MPGNTINYELAMAALGGANLIPDPGDGGTIHVGDKSHAMCQLEDAGGTETRTMMTAEGLQPGIQVDLVKVKGSSNVNVTIETIGGTSLYTFTDPHEFLRLVSAYSEITGRCHWIAIANVGVTVS
jgi:hypothetical protein